MCAPLFFEMNRQIVCRWLILAVLIAGSCKHQPEENGNPSTSSGARSVDPESHNPPGPSPVAEHSSTEADSRGSSDGTLTGQDHRTLVVGTWEDDYQGHRTLTVRADGTATMVVELDGVAATLYAKRMTFNEEWDIKNGQFILKVVGGEPEGRVNLIITTMGDVAEQKILELTADRMLLLDSDGVTEYDWRRVHVDVRRVD